MVNTFVKDALSTGVLRVFSGGEMWRPLVDVTDVARAHICVVEAPEEKVHAQIFNVAHKNYLVLELAHRVREALTGIRNAEIEVDYGHYKVRSYRVSTAKIESRLGVRAAIPVKESVSDMVRQVRANRKADFLNPVYYNIQWMTLLDRMEKSIHQMGSVFGCD